MTSQAIQDLEDSYFRKLKTLSETIWEAKANGPLIREWLSNFDGKTGSVESERIHALYLLTQFMYYGRREVRALLEAVYLDLFRYPLISNIRTSNGNTKDRSFIDLRFAEELRATRFIGIGGAADSGSMLLYELRKQCALDDNLFTTVDAVLANRPGQVFPNVRRYVFIDDLCASGDEAASFDKDVVIPLRARFGRKIEMHCFVLFATSQALTALQPPNTGFNSVRAVHELDHSFKAFSAHSRYFPADGLVQRDAKRVAEEYGNNLFDPALGHGGCELLLGFSHNIPDNTLPIIWSKEDGWKPIFERR